MPRETRMEKALAASRAVAAEVVELGGVDLLPEGTKGLQRRAARTLAALDEQLAAERSAAALLRRMLDGECETVLDPDVHAAFIAEARAVLGRGRGRR